MEEDLKKTAFLYPTMRCNLRCAICYSGAHKAIVKERLDEELTLEDYKRVIEKLYTLGTRIFDISGGEPLLCDFIFDLIRFIKSYRDTQIYLVSNGTLIEEKLEDISKVITLIDRFQISIDSYSEQIHDEMRGVKGTLKKAITGVQLLQNMNYDNIGINSVITQKNESTITELLEFAKSRKLSRVQLLRFIDVADREEGINHNVGKDEHMQIYQIVQEWVYANRNGKFGNQLQIELVLPGYIWKEISRIPKLRSKNTDSTYLQMKYDPFRGCSAFKQAIVVTSYGDITGCTGLINVRQFYCGNIKKQSTKQIEENFIKKIQLLKQREEYLKRQEPCQNCETYNSCKGGCPAIAFNYYGAAQHADPTCIRCGQCN